tara:strand:- start:3429 stop:4610 length:1182 start_codon:yes stop_codon:yes gene_type:complete
MSRWAKAKTKADSIIVADDLLKIQGKEEEIRLQQQNAYLDSISKAVDNVSKADAHKATILHNAIDAKIHMQTKEGKFEDARNALVAYDDFKNSSEIDEVELAYQQFLHDNTGPDGTYFLENYETFSKTDPMYMAALDAITPKGMSAFNPWWTPDPRKQEAFEKKDLDKRNQFLLLNQRADDMYDALIDKDGEPVSEYKEILNLRQEAYDSVLNYNSNAGVDTLDVIQLMVDEKKIKAEEVNISMDELSKSDNIQKLIDDLAETEYQARQTRSPLNYLSMGANPYVPSSSPVIMNPMLQSELAADNSLKAAADLDPNLFMTHLGLYDAGWDRIGAESSFYDEALTNPQEVVGRLKSEGINPELFGFMPEDYESTLDTGDEYFKELLLEAQNQAQ